MLFFTALSITVKAQEQKVAPVCYTQTVGGCWSIGIIGGCTATIYHIKTCCGKVHVFVGCWTTTWTTVNPEAKTPDSNPVTLEEIANQDLAKGKITDKEKITHFEIKTSEAINKDGRLVKIKPGLYKIDKTVPGWSLSELIYVDATK